MRYLPQVPAGAAPPTSTHTAIHVPGRPDQVARHTAESPRRPRTHRMLTWSRSFTRWAESTASRIWYKTKSVAESGVGRGPLCPPPTGGPGSPSSGRVSSGRGPGPPTGRRVIQLLSQRPSASCRSLIAAQPATATQCGCRNWEMVGQAIARLLLDPLGPSRAMMVALSVMSLVDKLPCFRAERPRVEPRCQHSVALGELLNPAEPQFPPLSVGSSNHAHPIGRCR